MPDTDERPEVTTHLDGYQRHKADPSNWDEAEVKVRPVRVSEPSTLASRAAARKGVKQVAPDDAEDKAVKKTTTKKAGAR